MCPDLRSAVISLMTVVVLAASAVAQTTAGGFSHTLIVKSDGTVWAVGANTFGALGDGTNTTRASVVSPQESVGGNAFQV